MGKKTYGMEEIFADHLSDNKLLLPNSKETTFNGGLRGTKEKRFIKLQVIGQDSNENHVKVKMTHLKKLENHAVKAGTFQ